MRGMFFTLSLCLVLFAACGGIGGNESETTDNLGLVSEPETIGAETSVEDAITLSEFAGGVLLSGKFSIHDFSTGAVGAEIASATFNGDMPQLNLDGVRGPIYLQVSEATFADANVNQILTFSNEDRWLAVMDYQGGSLTINVNAVTSIATSFALSLIEKKGLEVLAAIAKANSDVSEHFGVEDILRTLPVSLSAAATEVTPGRVYGAVLLGLGRLATDSNDTLLSLGRKLFSDLRDGLLDGSFNGQFLYTSGVVFTTELISTTLAASIQTVLQDTTVNQSGLTSANFANFLNGFGTESSFLSEITFFGDDFDPPAISLENIEDDLNDDLDDIIPLHVTATDEGSGVQSITVTVDGVTAVEDLNALPNVFIGNLNTTLFLDGIHTLEFVARDFAGNETSQSFVVSFENFIPNIVISVNGVEAQDNSFTGGAFKLRVEVTNENKLNSLDVTTDNVDVNTTLVDTNEAETIYETVIDAKALLDALDNLTITAEAQDPASNLSIKKVKLNIDSQGPSIQLIEPTQSVLEGQVTISATLSSNHFTISDAVVEVITIPGGDLFTLEDLTPEDGLESFSTVFDTTLLEDGDIVIRIRATDSVGVQNFTGDIYVINNVLFSVEQRLLGGAVAGFPAGVGPAIVTEDMNKDGQLDILTVSQVGSGSVPQFLGTFFGASLTQVTPNLIENQISPPDNNSAFHAFEDIIAVDRADGIVAVCDVDGDSNLDQIVGRPNWTTDGAITIHFGPQDPTTGDFAAAKLLLSPKPGNGQAPFGFGERIDCGDVNTDGKDDIIVDNTYQPGYYLTPGPLGGHNGSLNEVWILYGNSNRNDIDTAPTHARNLTYSINNGVNLLINMEVVGDVDGDGFNDMVVTNGSSHQVIYGPVEIATPLDSSNTSDLVNLSSQSAISTYLSPNFSWIEPVGDLNGDGRVDLAWQLPMEDITTGVDCCNQAGKAIISFSSSNRTTFVESFIELPRGFAVKNLTRFGRNIRAGDFNGDGVIDLFASAEKVDTDGLTDVEAVLLYKGPDYEQPPEMLVNSTADSGVLCGLEFEVADTNGDGQSDVIAVCKDPTVAEVDYRDILVFKDQ